MDYEVHNPDSDKFVLAMVVSFTLLIIIAFSL